MPTAGFPGPVDAIQAFLGRPDAVRLRSACLAVEAMRLVWTRMKILIEPSSAVPLAAILEQGWDARGKTVGVILTGGNVDIDRLPWAR